MNASRIAEIRARADAATAGPWMWQIGDSPYARHELHANAFLCKEEDGDEYVSGDSLVMLAECDEVLEEQDAGDWRPSAADADFIAHARQDIPDLIAEIERLRAALKPFADIVAHYGANYSDEYPIAENHGNCNVRIRITVGDCRRAAEVLKG